MKPYGNFPLDKKNNRKQKETFSEKSARYNKRRKHHCIIPVVNSAGGTASVAENIEFKGTEKQYADYVAHGIGEKYKNKYAFVDYSE